VGELIYTKPCVRNHQLPLLPLQLAAKHCKSDWQPLVSRTKGSCIPATRLHLLFVSEVGGGLSQPCQPCVNPLRAQPVPLSPKRIPPQLTTDNEVGGSPAAAALDNLHRRLILFLCEDAQLACSPAARPLIPRHGAPAQRLPGVAGKSLPAVCSCFCSRRLRRNISRRRKPSMCSMIV
jgi:hypothetical protein